MNAKTSGAISGAISGGKAGGPWGAVIGGVLGAARAGNAGQALAKQIGKNADGTLATPQEQMEEKNMLSISPDQQEDIMRGIDNGYGLWG